MVVVRVGGNDRRGEECTRHTLASRRPRSGRPTPCEHFKWRIDKGMGGSAYTPYSMVAVRGALKFCPNFEVRIPN
jgi:hypothetical protein